ncbi:MULTISPECIES: hypothetical protein [unclassified Pseudomonas]|uniref:hypothetical protein n=1 Tax=unclassified Pseudomonas TaxID=196821 RepID=UPI001115328C|nr:MULTISPECIES: hypothetical protein [unclassified Pseudomonas]
MNTLFLSIRNVVVPHESDCATKTASSWPVILTGDPICEVLHVLGGTLTASVVRSAKAAL